MSNLLPTLLLLLAPQQEPADELRALLDEAVSAPVTEVILLADRAELLFEQGWEDAAAAELDESSSAGQRLLIGRLLAQVGDERAREVVLPLLSQGRDQQMAGLATLRLASFQEDEAAQQALVDFIGDLIPDDDAELYCEACLTLNAIGDGARRRAAARYLKRTRESLDDQTVRLGALALGRSGALLEADTLELITEIAAGFGNQAAVAQSILDRQEQAERFRSKLEAVERVIQQREEARASGMDVNEDDAQLIAGILEMVEAMHIEGAKFDRQELLSAAADGLLRRLDPHSTYFTGEEYGSFWFDLNPEYGGIGAYVNTIDGVFTVVRPIYSGPAFEAGLMSDDKILSVDGWQTTEQPDDEIIKRLKGPPGTEVTLEVFRTGWSEPREYKLSRRKIELPVLQSQMLPGDVLYLELVSFTVDCGRMVAEAIRQAQEEGEVNGVVLDLRSNPGGSLDQAVAICDVFLERGKLVVTTNARVGEIERHVTRMPALVDQDIPLTILVNEYSASASEIVAGALSIHGRATTIGERTHGKGSVQIMRRPPGLHDEPFVDGNRNRIKDEWEEYDDLDGDGEYDFAPRVKLTVAYYYLPDGSTIHTQRDHQGRVTKKGGVEPDKKVEFWSYEPIVLRELDRLLEKGVFNEYADKLVDENLELAIELATFDARDVSRYPGWSEFYNKLDTFLDEDVARQWVRRRLRISSEISDARGTLFPGGGFRGDFAEDPQLEAGIREVLLQAGKESIAFPEYAASWVVEDPNAAQAEEDKG